MCDEVIAVKVYIAEESLEISMAAHCYQQPPSQEPFFSLFSLINSSTLSEPVNNLSSLGKTQTALIN